MLRRWSPLSRSLLPAACLAVAALLACLACSTEPPRPDLDNPLDPDGPSHGDPFQVEAVMLSDAVRVSWQDPGLDGITGYEVLRSLVRDGTYEVVGSATVTFYNDTTFVPDTLNYYKVRALDATGMPTAVSLVTPAELAVPPLVRLTPNGSTPGRQISVWVRSSVGDSAAVDSTEAFTTAVGAAFAGTDTARLAWDLGPADSNGTVKNLYVRVFAAGAPTGTVPESLTVAFRPALALAGQPATVARRRLDLVMNDAGMTEMRFAADRAGLAAAPWLPPAGTYGDYEVAATLDTQMVFGEFRSEFGFTVVESLVVAPDSLAHVELTIAGGAEATSDTAVVVHADAVATEMRYAESVAALAVTPWEPYTPSTLFVHSGCDGDLLKTIYGQFRNDFAGPVDPVSASIQWLPPEVLTVTLDAPDTVSAGTTVTVTGTAHPGTCTPPLDAVELDTGDGWQPVTGLAAWSREWDVPAVAADTTVTLRARATAGTAADTTTADVVIVP